MRKPHANNAGYVAELRCKLGGHVVIYDRQAGFECDADDRWIVMHEPSSNHVSVGSLAHARSVMKGVARASTLNEACRHADILPHREDMQTAIRDTKLTKEQLAALDRFWADPENEPSKEGKQALAILFGRQS
jgi:hypothetical protein